MATKKTVYSTAIQTTAVTVKMKKVKIGYLCAGGIVFYIDASEEHGLVAAPKDQGEYKLEDALSVCEKLLLNGYSDWRLPSKGELYLMNNSLKEEIIGGLRIAIIGLCLSLFYIYQEKRALILLKSNLLTI